MRTKLMVQGCVVGVMGLMALIEPSRAEARPVSSACASVLPPALLAAARQSSEQHCGAHCWGLEACPSLFTQICMCQSHGCQTSYGECFDYGCDGGDVRMTCGG
jgi:hypothetical protein